MAELHWGACKEAAEKAVMKTGTQEQGSAIMQRLCLEELLVKLAARQNRHQGWHFHSPVTGGAGNIP